MHLGSLESAQEARVAPRATLTLLSCSPNFPRASVTRYTHAKHEPILKLIANNRTDALKTDVKLLFMITNCQINRSRFLTCPINYNFMCLFAYWQWKLANERAKISAVIVKKIYIYRIRTIWHRNPKPHSHSYPAVFVKIIIDGRKIPFWYFVSINIAELKVTLIQTYIHNKH